MRLTPLSISQILKAADDYYAREKKWPQAKSAGFVACNTEQVTWRNVDQALRKGLRKLPAGSSLAMLLAQHRGVRNRKALPRLSVRQILFWADLHQERTGEWPTRESGQIEEAPGETWCAAEMALCHGQRGCPTAPRWHDYWRKGASALCAAIDPLSPWRRFLPGPMPIMLERIAGPYQDRVPFLNRQVTPGMP
jgi:hypothetical protein